jgi:multidrug transporter EmrE-like cation transporter
MSTPELSSTRLTDYVYILGTVAFTVYGQVVTKWQVRDAGPLPAALSDKLLFVGYLMLNPWVMSSLLAAVLAFACWVMAMTKFSLSTAYPFTSLSFVLVMFLSAFFFREPITAAKVLALVLIIAGLIVGSRV